MNLVYDKENKNIDKNANGAAFYTEQINNLNP